MLRFAKILKYRENTVLFFQNKSLPLRKIITITLILKLDYDLIKQTVVATSQMNLLINFDFLGIDAFY